MNWVQVNPEVESSQSSFENSVVFLENEGSLKVLIYSVFDGPSDQGADCPSEFGFSVPDLLGLQ